MWPTPISRSTLRSRRLVLEPTCDSHAPGLWAAVSASVGELAPWMGWAVEPQRQETLDFVASAAQSWGSSLFNFTIICSDEIIGSIGLDHFDDATISASIGYWLRSDHAGKGLMSEAVGSVVAFAFTDLTLHRIWLHAGVDNLGSIRVAEKTGFLREGRLRESGRGVHGWHDVYVYGLLESDERPRVV
ncbi:MAG: GNAT family N-acetyltransferase [Actinomycetota bacterium]|nr:GNAT family N-acetyltransferase [Actinomycetota bacterium]